MARTRLGDAEVETALARLAGWRRTGDPVGIERTYRFGGFGEAVSFVVRVAMLAEAANHHPDLDLRWDRVRVFLTTHDAGGLTEHDVALATRVDHVAAGWARE